MIYTSPIEYLALTHSLCRVTPARRVPVHSMPRHCSFGVNGALCRVSTARRVPVHTMPRHCSFGVTGALWRLTQLGKLGPHLGVDGLGAGPYTRRHSAQRKRFMWDRGCIEGWFRAYFAGVKEVSGGVGGCWGVQRVCFVSDTAQVELNSGRV